MESENPMTSTNKDAARMMAEVRAANAELARRAVAPVWHHPALGLLAGGLIAMLGQPAPLILAYEAVFGLGCWLLVVAYKRRTGLWVSGYRKGRTRWLALALGAAYAVVAVTVLWAYRQMGVTWAPYAGGGLVAVVTTIQGFVWEAAFRRDLRDEGGL
jgi:hypothetical protein